MSIDNVWTYDKLWSKAKIYMQKALDEDRESEMFPFWSALGLEFVARATLAKIHPALLADPTSGEHLLYVFGYQSKPNYIPISIPTKTVLERCEAVVANFTENEKRFCKDLTNRRNEEMHSGGLGFDRFPTRKWLSKFYKTIKILLDAQNKTLEDFLGKDEAGAVIEMIVERDATLEKVVRDRVSKHKTTFFSLTKEEQEEIKVNHKINNWKIEGRYKKEEVCPSCDNAGILSGKLISVSDGIAGSTEIIQKLNVLPIGFKCICCKLELLNHLELDVIEMGGQYKVEEAYDPKDYYDLSSFEPDFDYGND